MSSTRCKRNGRLRLRHPDRAAEFDRLRLSGDLPKSVRLEDFVLGRRDDRSPECGACESCGAQEPLVESTGLCGPCCFGEAETAGGNF